MKKPELLAPAGNKESLIQAINHGADAVYMGLSSFNARGNIENFNEENLRECVERAHLFGVKVFLTLNTIILDDEIEDVLSLVRNAIKAKVDAFIVQDLGLAYLLKNKFSNIELHASTQMGASTLEAVKFLEKFGYSRYVLARETSLNEIKRISKNLNVELEYFVQGALCVSFSGNCYLCSLCAGASGNRGKCKQFCRLPITLENQNMVKEGYFLSTKDFCMLPRLKELVESGITSLKIEGRARRPAYVAGAVKVYREALDNHYKYNADSIHILKRLFNRGGYITGYLESDNIIYNKNQNHIGERIGEVLSINKGRRFNEVVVSSNHHLQKGDALKFFVDEVEMCSLSVQDVKKVGKDKFAFTTTVNVPLKSKVNLIVDSALENQLLETERKLEVDAVIDFKVGEPAIMKLQYKDVFVKVSGDVLEEAKAQPLTKEECLAQISKMGEDFCLKGFEGNIENVFMVKSQLNKLRREAIDKLRNKIIEFNEQNLNVTEKEFEIENSKTKSLSCKNMLYFNDLNILERCLDKNDYLVFNPDKYDFDEISNFCKRHQNITIYLSLPVLAEEGEIKLFKDLLSKYNNLGIVANNYYALELTDKNKTVIGSNMNVANSFTVYAYANLGFDKIVLTKENFDIDNIKSFGKELFVETKIPKTLMHFKHCPFKDNLNSACDRCGYKANMKYKFAGKKFIVRRKKILACQFELIEESYQNNNLKLKFGEVIEIAE